MARVEDIVGNPVICTAFRQKARRSSAAGYRPSDSIVLEDAIVASALF
jgi:hypothetical protein